MKQKRSTEGAYSKFKSIIHVSNIAIDYPLNEAMQREVYTRAQVQGLKKSRTNNQKERKPLGKISI